MLAGMILHSPESLHPIQLAPDFFANRQRTIGDMHHIVSPLFAAEHPDIIQRTGIRQLTAAAGEKGGLVQNHLILLPHLFAGKHFCSKRLLMAVCII